MSDTRLLNWRFVVPNDGNPLLLLPAADETVPDATVVHEDAGALRSAIAAGRFRGVVAADLTRWARVDRGAGALLRRLASVPEEGGWIYASFPNPLLARSGKPGLRLPDAIQILKAAGYETTVYVAFPSHRQPAWLVPISRRFELDHFLSRMAFPYAPTGSPWVSWIAARLLQAARVLALRLPHQLRVRFAPAYAVVGRRAP